MRLARVSFAQSLDALEDADVELPAVDSAALADAYPGLTQSLTQVLHGTEEKTNQLLGR